MRGNITLQNTKTKTKFNLKKYVLKFEKCLLHVFGSKFNMCLKHIFRQRIFFMLSKIQNTTNEQFTIYVYT